MQAAPEKQEPLAIVLNCELGRDIDNALTLALLHGLSTLEEPEAKFLAVSLTESNLRAAAYCDAVGRFYSKIHLREFPQRFQRYRGFAVGLEELDMTPPSQALAAALDRKDDQGEPLYPHEVQEMVDTADPVALIRNAITAQADDACGVVLSGSATSLAALLGLNGAREMIQAKVRLLAVAMDPARALSDLAAARRLFAEWPSPIVAIASTAIEFSADASFDWTENHPIADALDAHGKNLGTLGLAASLHAVRPDSSEFELTEPGTVTVDDDGSLRFQPGDGEHRMLTASGGALPTIYQDLVTAEPAPRDPPDFIKRILDREKEEAEKKEEPTP